MGGAEEFHVMNYKERVEITKEFLEQSCVVSQQIGQGLGSKLGNDNTFNY